MKKTLSCKILCALLCTSFAFSLSFTAAAASKKSGDTVTIPREEYERYQQMDDLLEIMDMIDQGFYDEADHKTMLDGAAYGMLAFLDDPYTFYYDQESFSKMMEDNEDDYVGVGMMISSNYSTGLCTVSRVFKDSPAEKAGVHRGDVLYKVADIYIDPYTVNDAVDIIRGEEGTNVVVTFRRDEEEIAITMTRARVENMRVESGMIDNSIGYIALYEFEGNCADKFKEELNKLLENGAEGLIIDLRDNPGGWLTSAQDIGDLFLDKGVLCYLEYKDGSKEYTYTHAGHVDIPLVIIVNENSASASELLTGALRDRADATVVGTQSFGKGIAQVVLPVGDDGAGMQMTVAQYFTPDGTKVHKIGITPDVIAEADPESSGIYDFADMSDPQLAKAYDVIKEKTK